MPIKQETRITMLEHELINLRELHKIHREEINISLRVVTENFSDNLKEIRTDIKNIYEFINRSRGGITVLVFAASTLGGVVVAVVSWAMGHFLH